MKKKHFLFFLIILSLFLISACDARRNQILVHMIVSPTMTVTPEPPTATPTDVPTVMPTLTPTPFASVENLDLLMFGDYDLAEYNIRGRIGSITDSTELLKAQTDLLQLAYLREDYEGCMAVMDEINETVSGMRDRPSAVLGKANYIHAQCAEAAGNTDREIDSLDKYLAYRRNTPLISDTYIQIAYAYRTLEDHEMFRKYIDRAENGSEGAVNDYVKLDYAVSYIDDRDYSKAVELLTALYEAGTDDNIKAASDYYLGIAHNYLGEKDQTIACYQDAVNKFPKSYYSYQMLLWLLENYQIVSDYQRGLINYYVGQYALANDAFRRYVKNDPSNDGSSWYFIGVCQMNLADYEGAVSSFSKLIDEYPENRYYISAWDELAYVQWYYMDRYQAGAKTLTDYVARHQDQADSASFLYEAGRILERGNYLTEAAKTWARLIDEYPLYENSPKALFYAAICSYRTGDYETSMAFLNRLLLVSGVPEDLARANFWIAKIYQKRNDAHNTEKYLETAAGQSRTGYYSLRAAELRKGDAYLTLSGTYDLKFDLDAERQVADQWMMLTFSLSPDDLTDNSAYRSDNDYVKGLEYYTLGAYRQASASFEKVQEKLVNEPAASYAFLDEMVSMNMYCPAAYTSRQILTAAGLIEDDRTLEVPNYFNHIRFGAWYSSYVEDVSGLYDVSPLILYAIIKQESMYNPWVTSSAGARGLMQVMPETGAEIAKTLHWPSNYKDSDLNRVPVAVNFGASYLRRVYAYFDQNKVAMLAAYNGGSGNTQQWLNLSGNDPDLLFEVIRFQETRNYIQNIYRNGKIFEWFYAK